MIITRDILCNLENMYYNKIFSKLEWNRKILLSCAEFSYSFILNKQVTHNKDLKNKKIYS